MINHAKQNTRKNHTEALKLAKTALQLSKEIKYTKGELIANARLGLINYYLGRHETSISYYKKNIKVAEKLNNSDAIAVSYLNIAIANFYLNNYHLTLKNCVLGLQFTNKRVDIKIKLFQQLAETYTYTNQYKNAIEAFDKAIKIALKQNDPTKFERTIAELTINKGYAFYKLKKTEVAYNLYLKSKAIIEKHKNNYTTILLYDYLTEFHLKNKKLDSAKFYTSKILEITKKEKFANSENKSTYIAGKIQLLEGNYKLAKTYFDASLKMANAINYKKLQKDIYYSLYELNIAINKHKTAYNYLKKYSTINHNAAINEIKNTFNTTNLLYQDEIKTHEINTQKLTLEQQANKLKKKQQQAGFIFSSLAILLLALIQILIVFKSKKKISLKQVENLKIENQVLKLGSVLSGEKNEKKRLVQDLNYIVTSDLSSIIFKLESIQSGAINTPLKNQINTIIKQFEKSITHIQNLSSDFSEKPKIEYNLSKLLQKYCDKISLLSPTNFTFNNLTNNLNITNKQKTELYRIVQELVNNILKHAQATAALIVLKNDNTGKLELTIKDNGVGFDKNTVKSGIGMKSLKTRVESLHGELLINSTLTSGTTTKVVIPIG